MRNQIAQLYVYHDGTDYLIDLSYYPLDGNSVNVPITGVLSIGDRGGVNLDLTPIFTDFDTVGILSVFVPDTLPDGVLSCVGDFPMIGQNNTFLFSDTVFYDFVICPDVPASKTSLNGDYQSFKDGDAVFCYPRTDSLTVVSSSFVASGENSFTILYELVSPTGNKHFAPQEYLTKV